MTRKEDDEFGEHFVVGAALANPTESEITLTTMTGSPFSVELTQRTFTEDGEEYLWSPENITTQASTG